MDELNAMVQKMAEDMEKLESREFILITPEMTLYKGTADQLAPIILKDASFMNSIYAIQRPSND